MNNYIFTSESVSSGHPDKVADQISDALVDAGLKNGDSTTRVAIETLVTTNHVTLAGEVKNFNVTKEEVKEIVRNKVREIGYEQEGFHWDKLNIYNEIHSQSADIALGTDDFGAGDQGIMFGYACNDNDAYLPAPIYYAHEILKELKTNGGKVLGPDAKSQVSVEYEGGKVKRIDQVVISTQHSEGQVDQARNISKLAAKEVLGDLIDDKTNTLFEDRILSKVDFVSSVCPCAGLSLLNYSGNSESGNKRGSDASQNEWLYKSTEFVSRLI